MTEPKLYKQDGRGDRLIYSESEEPLSYLNPTGAASMVADFGSDYPQVLLLDDEPVLIVAWPTESNIAPLQIPLNLIEPA